MKHLWLACLAAGLLVAGGSALADRPSPVYVNVEQFATMPAGVRYPEGLTADPASGDIFAATFDNTRPNNKLVRFGKNGKVEAVKDFGATPMLGLEFRAGNVYILNFGTSMLQRIPANFDASTPVQDLAKFPSIGPPGPRPALNPDGSSDVITFGSNGFPAANAMVFDKAGNLYVSDSFQGAIYRIANATACPACAVVTIAHDPLLATPGFPPFGANGVSLNADESALFIANTGDNRVLKMPLPSGPIAVFAESVHGADGTLFADGLLWVCANQGDYVVALDANGRPVARAGEFEGINHDGTPRGLLFPASPARVGDWIYVSNLSLPLTPMVGDEPEEDVTRWSISRFHIPH
jgi:DNA-binding beta-propeller fold protein YncE